MIEMDAVRFTICETAFISILQIFSYTHRVWLPIRNIFNLPSSLFIFSLWHLSNHYNYFSHISLTNSLHNNTQQAMNVKKMFRVF